MNGKGGRGWPFSLLAVAFLAASLWASACSGSEDRGGAGAGAGPGPKPRDEKNRFVRASALAGNWYPDDGQKLREEVAGYLRDAAEAIKKDGAKLPEGRLTALVSPHAGYRYSGPVAAFGYSLLAPGQYSRVIVLGISHHFGFSGISTPDETHYETPLGLVPIDREAIEKLRAGSPLFVNEPKAEAVEHSIEIQIPFLQTALGDFKLVPLLVGRLAPADTAAAAERIRAIVDGRTLVVASSDFTHYGPSYDYVPFPPGPDAAAKLEGLDMGAVKLIRALDTSGFDEYRRQTGATICGALPTSVLMALLSREAESVLLRYDTSGREMGDYKNSVSYVSLAFFTKTAPASEAALAAENSPAAEASPAGRGEPGAVAVALAPEELSTALALARASLENHLAPKPASKAEVLARFRLTDALKARAGAFVTLEKKGILRGCIGSILAHEPLYEALYENAIRAAANDPRFSPVTLDELPALTVEVSVLSPLRPIVTPDEFEVGKQGVLMKKGLAQAVFLPQVAPEQGWGRDETLRHLSEKAGLSPDAWRAGASFWVFTAQVLGEEAKASGKENGRTRGPGG